MEQFKVVDGEVELSLEEYPVYQAIAPVTCMKQFKFVDGDLKLSLEEYPADGPGGSGAMRKILVGMKIPFAAPPVGQLRFKVISC